jgi:tetratricopeptide (TPR) repeat protein
MGVAPGLAGAPIAVHSAHLPTVPPEAVSPPAYASRDAFSREERSRRIGLTLVTLVIGIATLVIGGWGLSRAYENYQGQMSAAQITGEYKSATTLYTSGQFEQAADAFRRLRTAGSSSTEIVTKATQGEIYSYRQLAHAAQNRNDFAGAVRWYREAIKLNPTDSQVLAELAAVERRIGPPSQPDAVPTPSAVLPSALPSISSSSYAASNAQAASEADAFFQQGEAAYRQGNGTAALRYWSAAVAAGPGTPAALQAQERISRNNSTTSPY